MSKKVLLTGDRPSGPLHLGHYVGSLENRVKLQEKYEALIVIADIQALTDNFENPDKVKENVYEVVKDYLAVGIDPLKTTIFIQSQIHELYELTCYYMNLVTVARLERNPTVKLEIRQKGFGDRTPVGFFCYPISQAADITAFGDVPGKILVPVGEDQLPMIELTNEIVRRFNQLYHTDCLQEAEAYLGEVKRLVGIDGQNKASKSLNNAIFLKDSPEVIKEKVFAMFTDPNHLKVSDPGKIEGNVVFDYLSVFHKDKQELEELKAHYKKGGLGDTMIKGILNTSLQAFLEPIREKRASITHDEIHQVLLKGTQKARKKAQIVTERVREAMKLCYKGF